jgi:transposase InsO family protein
MPWSETTKMRERMRFVLDAEEELFTMTELCQRYGISRVTGHKWLKRFRGQGVQGLEDLSRAAQHSPHQTPAAIVEMIAEARRHHPTWGARKLIRWLQRRGPNRTLPAPSTARDILKRLGLITPRRPRRHLPHPGRGLTEALAPNQVWTADFKGQFRTKDGRYCYPLTVADSFSRYLLACRSQLSVETIPTRTNFQRLFKQYGLPRTTARPLPKTPEPSSASSTPSASSSTTSGLTRRFKTNCPPTSTNPPRDPSPIACLSPSTPDTSKSARSARTAASAGRKAGSTSATACSSSTSAWRKSTTVSGPFTSAPCCSADSTRTTSPSRELDSIETEP